MTPSGLIGDYVYVMAKNTSGPVPVYVSRLINTLPTPVPTAACPVGDADGNRFVNGLDYGAVRDHYGEANPTSGDANCDGFVNSDDFRAVRDNFGKNYT
jgi:hypothetical protein